MIIESTDHTIESSGILKELEFGIRAENMGFILNILRNNLYSDKILAIIREYSANAKDAHVASGQPNRPIKVTLPTQFECFFKVRDYGAGLSESDVEDVFVNYGCSTKRESNSAIGAFGLGAKCAFSITDAFTVNSYQNGICYAYTLFIDESKRGKMSLMNKSETPEPNGVEVVVPINYQDISLFKDKAVEFFKFWDVIPNFENLDVGRTTAIQNFRDSKANFEGPNWKVFGADGISYAIMGNVPYRLDRLALGVNNAIVNTVLSKQCHLYFNIGDLDIVASREAVEFTDKSKAAIVKLVTEIYNSIKAEIEAKFGNCKTLWEARCLYNEVFNMSGKYYHYRGMSNNVLKFQGKPINEDRFRIGHTFNGCFSVYIKKSLRRYSSAMRVRRTDYAYDIKASSRSAVVIKDGDYKCLMNRLVPLIEDGNYDIVYFFEGTDIAKWEDFVKESDFDGPTTLLSSLPKVNLQKYYPKNMTGVSSPYVGIKVVKLRSPITYKSYLSDYWESATLDLAQDAAVYLPIKNYLVQSTSLGKPIDHYSRPDKALSKIIVLLKTCNITIPDIYGIKLSAVAKAKVNPKMIDFHTWAIEEIKKLIAANDPSDYQQFQEFSKTEAYQLVQQHRFVSKLDQNLDLTVFAARVKSLDKSNNILASVVSLASAYSLPWTNKPSISLEKEAEKLRKRYPLLFRFANSLGGYYTDSGILEDFLSYVKMINEKCNQSTGGLASA